MSGRISRAAVTLTILASFLGGAGLAHAQKGGKGVTAKPDPDGKTEELNIAVGENKTINAADVKNYSEGTPGVVDIKLTSDSTQFVIVGLKAGSTSLLLIKKNGQEINWVINVFARSPAIVESEVKQLLEGYTNVKVRRVGSRFFIEGSVSSEADVKRIAQIAGLYSGQVESLVGVGGGKDRTNIRIDFFFVQYNKSSGYQVGISWPGRVGGEVVQSNIGYDFVAKAGVAVTNVVNQPLPGLDIASHHGWAKVSKQATVITTNGTDATLESGGEQNFPIAAGLTSTIQKIPFGTSVTVQPMFDPVTRELEIKVSAEVADLVQGIKSTPLPGRQTTKLSTIVHMKLGQSLVISGIHTKDQRHSVDGIPLLSQIPIIGILFGSHQDEKNEVEGAVLIVPSVVESGNSSASNILEETMKKYEDYSGDSIPSHYEKKPPADFVPPTAIKTGK
jgi:pilus assembly protein CpaC